MTELLTDQIQARFQNEQSNIGSYVHYIERLAFIDDNDIRQINRTLAKQGLKEIHLREGCKRRDPYTQRQLRALSGSIKGTSPQLESRIEFLDDAFDAGEDSLDRVPEGYKDFAYGWFEYFKQSLPQGASEDQKTKLIDNAFGESKWANPDAPKSSENAEQSDLEDASDEIDKAIMRTCVDQVEREWKLEEIYQLRNIRNSFKNLTFACRLRTHNAEIHLLRQGFILLMTAFDAAVFDLTRVALHKDFFGQIGRVTKNTKQETVPLSRMADFGTFDKFRTRVIEDQLKRLYVKDLIGILNDGGVELVPASTGCKLVHLFELVLRRNLHVHNRGIVDERYLECEPNSKPKYNLDGFKLGDFAEITPDYWKRVNTLTLSAINQIATWTATLPLKPD